MSIVYHEVDVLAGIGKVYKDKLNKLGIFTVQDLIRTPKNKVINGSINVYKYQQLVHNAENYMKLHNGDTKSEEKRKKESAYEQYYTISHTWYEECAKIVDIDHQEIKDVIISELHFDPNERITFLCSWIENETILCERSYSPHYLRTLSPQLPVLELELSKLDMQSINVQSLLRTLEEVNTIHKIQSHSQ